MSTIEELKGTLTSMRLSFVGIDGCLASGKSTLAKHLAFDLGFSCIHIDDFVDKGKRQYFSAIRFDELTRKIELSSHPLILEGVCLLEILNTLKIVPDYLVYLSTPVDGYQKRSDALEKEVDEYAKKYMPARRADLNIRSFDMKTQHDVDIVYLKSRTLFSSLLALGGIISVIVGAFLLNAGLQGDDSAIFKIMGAEISAKGIGGVILTTSTVWAYLAYRSRPVYRHKKETKKSVGSDGSVEEWETESSTRTITNSSDED